MIGKLLQLVVIVVVGAIIALFLDWAMTKLAVIEIVRTVVWIAFGLIVLLAVAGLFGYGPAKGSWSGP
jgi:predicted membrane channel-forming protein YqfA (hemolysin III family)